MACGTVFARGVIAERWLSGLRHTPGKRAWAYTPPRVRIPLSPPFDLRHHFAALLKVCPRLLAFLIEHLPGFHGRADFFRLGQARDAHEARTGCIQSLRIGHRV